MEGGFYQESNGNIHVHSFSTDTAFLSSAADFYSKWHYMSFYRSGSNIGYCWDGIVKETSSSDAKAAPNPFTLYFGSTSGQYEYSGIMASMSILLRLNSEPISTSAYYL